MARRFQQFSIELELGTFNAGDAVSTGAFHHRILGVRRRSRCRAMKRPSLRNGSSGWSTLANRDRASRCHFWHPGRVLLTWADTLALSLVNPMRQLDASDRYRCIGERFEAQHESAAAFDRAMAGLRPMPYERKPLPPQCLDRVGAESRRSCPACRRQLSAQRRLIIDAIRGGLLGPQAVWQGGRRSEIVPERESAAHRVRTISAVLISMGRN
jgi:hypothetical protein